MRKINRNDFVLIRKECLEIVSKRNWIQTEEKLCGPFMVKYGGNIVSILRGIDMAIYNEELVIINVNLM